MGWTSLSRILSMILAILSGTSWKGREEVAHGQTFPWRSWSKKEVKLTAAHLVMCQQEQRQVSPLPPRSLAEKRMVGLGHVRLQADGGDGGLETELLVAGRLARVVDVGNLRGANSSYDRAHAR